MNDATPTYDELAAENARLIDDLNMFGAVLRLVALGKLNLAGAEAADADRLIAMAVAASEKTDAAFRALEAENARLKAKVARLASRLARVDRNPFSAIYADGEGPYLAGDTTPEAIDNLIADWDRSWKRHGPVTVTHHGGPVAIVRSGDDGPVVEYLTEDAATPECAT